VPFDASHQTRLHLNERPLGELLVDLGFVHDVLGPAGVLQRAQSLLHRPKERQHAHAVFPSPETESKLQKRRETRALTSMLLEDGDTVAMIEVFVRPPRESCRILVSLDSLLEECTVVITRNSSRLMRHDEQETEVQTC